MNKLKGMFGLGLSLASANFKLRNEGSYFGILWYLLNPLALFLIILLIRASAFSNTEIQHYPLYLLMGLITINFFNKVIGASINVIKKNSSLLRNIKFDHTSLIISELLQVIYGHVFEILLFGIIMFYFGVPLVGLFGYALVFIFFTIFLVGIAFLFAVLGLYISDLNNIWLVASQLIFFITPIFHILKPGTSLSTMNQFNPLYYFLESFRDVTIYQTVPSLFNIQVMFVLSLCSLLLGYFIFDRKKKYFAELT